MWNNARLLTKPHYTLSCILNELMAWQLLITSSLHYLTSLVNGIILIWLRSL
ncbi:MAG: hypothetical protein ACI90U_002697 [Pseudomonadales bacterium]|jgi:hypothetical protein